MTQSMEKMAEKTEPNSVFFRHYKDGDEADILNLLNLCYGQWGNIKQWHWLYTKYPGFTSSDVFIGECNGNIIAHRGLHYRHLDMNARHKVLTVAHGDSAVHPDFVGRGLYSKLHRTTLEAAKNRGACLDFTWTFKGSLAYQHHMKTGFLEINQAPSFMKIFSPDKVLRAGLRDFLHKNRKMSTVLHSMKTELYLRVGEAEFCTSDLLAKPALSSDKKHSVRFILADEVVYWLANFRTSSRPGRIKSLALLLLAGKVRMKFGSLYSLLELARKGVAILGSL